MAIKAQWQSRPGEFVFGGLFDQAWTKGERVELDIIFRGYKSGTPYKNE